MSVPENLLGAPDGFSFLEQTTAASAGQSVGAGAGAGSGGGALSAETVPDWYRQLLVIAPLTSDFREEPGSESELDDDENIWFITSFTRLIQLLLGGFKGTSPRSVLWGKSVDRVSKYLAPCEQQLWEADDKSRLAPVIKNIELLLELIRYLRTEENGDSFLVSYDDRDILFTRESALLKKEELEHWFRRELVHQSFRIVMRVTEHDKKVWRLTRHVFFILYLGKFPEDHEEALPLAGAGAPARSDNKKKKCVIS